MDVIDVALGITVIAGIAAYARWYFKQPDDEEEILSEMDGDLDDRIKELFDNNDQDEDPYGEMELNHDSYRATLVNRGTTANKE